MLNRSNTVVYIDTFICYIRACTLNRSNAVVYMDTFV